LLIILPLFFSSEKGACSVKRKGAYFQRQRNQRLLSDTTYYTQQHSSMLSAGIVITRSQELQGKIDQLNWPVSVRPFRFRRHGALNYRRRETVTLCVQRRTCVLRCVMHARVTPAGSHHSSRFVYLHDSFSNRGPCSRSIRIQKRPCRGVFPAEPSPSLSQSLLQQTVSVPHRLLGNKA
jgi:hypothetical protein